MIYTARWSVTKTGSLQVCYYFCFPPFIFHTSAPILSQNRKLMQSQRCICSSFAFFLASLFSLFSLFLLLHVLPHSCLPEWGKRWLPCIWRCLSAWVIHGNGKVQTGAVGGHGFLLFSPLDAFFLKSLTGPKLKKPKVPDLASFPLYTQTVISLFIHVQKGLHNCHAKY